MKNPARLWLKIATLTLLILAAVGFYFFLYRSATAPTVKETQQFTNLKVAQFYLHLPDDDFIIGRESDKYNKLSNVVVKTATSLSKPVPELSNWPEMAPEVKHKTKGKKRSPQITTQKSISNQNTKELKSIQDFKENTVSLSVWLMESQKISTRNKADVGLPKDKYGNSVITTNRLMFVLSGKYMGTVFVRDDKTGTWAGWESEKGSVMPLVELVRSGGL